jgi:hypothetical protein
MSAGKLLLSVISIACFLSILGPTAESAQGACLSIGMAEVDFGQRFLGVDPKIPVDVKNECGESVEITATGFVPYTLDMSLIKNECTAKKELAANKTCPLEFTYKPTVAGKSKALMGVHYFSPKLKEEKYSFWVTGSGRNRLKVNKPGPFSAAGELTLDVSGVFILNCPSVTNGELWNEGEEEAAVGELASFTPTASGCETNFPGCSVAAAHGANLPWGVGAHEALEESELDLFDLNEIEIVFELESGCSIYGLPKTISAAGSVTGTFDNPTSCIEFSESPGLILNGVAPADLSGELCVTEPEGLELE